MDTLFRLPNTTGTLHIHDAGEVFNLVLQMILH